MSAIRRATALAIAAATLGSSAPAAQRVVVRPDSSVTREGQLKSSSARVEYRLQARAGLHLLIRIEPIGALATAGIVIYPSGKSDGGPGGIIFDSTLDETGDYRVRVSARENTAPGRFRIQFELRAP